MIENQLFDNICSLLQVDADTMLITAGCGVAFNIVMASVLMFGSGGHGHSHGGLRYGRRADGKYIVNIYAKTASERAYLSSF